jgi:DNA-binding NtrC family response regulator
MNDEGKISLLVVEDNELLRVALRRHLRRAPAVTRVAEAAEEALKLVAEEVPDLLISDYRMVGNMDGLSLLERVHAEHPGVRCVLHTGESPDTTLLVSVFPVLFKPCPMEVFYELIESVRLEHLK